MTNYYSGAPGYVTLTDTLDNVIAHGLSPLHVAIPATGQYRAHWTDDAACGSTQKTEHTATAVFINSLSGCIPPSGITATGIAATSANINWTAFPSNPANGYEYVITTTYGMPTSSGTPMTATSLATTTLAPSTQYFVYVRAMCAGGTSLWNSATFITACLPTVTAPWTEDFDGATFAPGDWWPFTLPTLDSCWTTIPISNLNTYSWWVGAGSTSFIISTGPSADHTTGVTGAGQYIYTSMDGGDSDDIAAILTPLIDISGITNPALRFWKYFHGPDIGYFFVEVDTGNGFQTIYTTYGSGPQTAETDPWVEEEVDLTPFAGSMALQIRFRSIHSWGLFGDGDIALDDISVDVGPPCLKPSAISIVSVGITDVTLDWVPGSGASWEVAYGAPGFDPDAAVGSSNGPAGIVPAGAHPFTLTGLAASTDYHFYVREACATVSGANSGWRGFARAHTNCSPVVTAPWIEDFEGLLFDLSKTFIPCWTPIPVGTPFPYRWVLGTSGPGNGGPDDDHTTAGAGKFLWTLSGYGSTGDQAEIWTPLIDISGVINPTLRFWKHFYGGFVDSFFVEVSTGSGFQTIFATYGPGPQTSTADPWIEEVLDLNAFAGSTALQIRFRSIHGGPYNGHVALDDVSVGPPCFLNTSSATIISVSCFGANDGTAAITASGGTPPYSYLWDTGDTTSTLGNLTAGTYQVTIADAYGCIIDNQVVVTEPAELIVTGNSPPNSGTAIVSTSGGTPPYSYLWNTGDITLDLTNLTAGLYRVTVTDANGCSDTAGIDVIVGMEELDLARYIDLYPNPTTDEVFIDYNFTSEVDLKVTVMNHLGQVVLTISEPNAVSGQLRLEVAEWASGIYNVLFSSGSQNDSRQLMIQK